MEKAHRLPWSTVESLSSPDLIAPGARESITPWEPADGSGLEADQKVIARHECYAMTATTAVTVQSTQGVQAIHHVPTAITVQQIRAVLDDIGADVIKIGTIPGNDRPHGRNACFLGDAPGSFITS